MVGADSPHHLGQSDFEDEMIPSITALKRHWQRSCWVLHMWRQATNNEMNIESPVGNGWIEDNGKLAIDWESQENIQKVRKRVDLLLKGCACKTGCKTNRCSCKRNCLACSPGCRCMHCCNDDSPSREEDILEAEVDDIMNSVFGENNEHADGRQHGGGLCG